MTLFFVYDSYIGSFHVTFHAHVYYVYYKLNWFISSIFLLSNAASQTTKKKKKKQAQPKTSRMREKIKKRDKNKLTRNQKNQTKNQ
jgi:hypothetical protein